MMNDASSILVLKDIVATYEKGKPVLNGISLSLQRGEILGIRGENGAGKTTLMGVMAGIIRPESGTRELVPELEGNISIVPQEIALYPSLTGRQNLEFWAEIYGVRGAEKKEKIRSLLTRTRLEEKADKKLETYSGGMKRRLNLAAALVITPKLLLLDEPTVGIDMESIEELLCWLRELKKEGTSIVLISHQFGEEEKVCDRIITLKNGFIDSEEMLSDKRQTAAEKDSLSAAAGQPADRGNGEK